MRIKSLFTSEGYYKNLLILLISYFVAWTSYASLMMWLSDDFSFSILVDSYLYGFIAIAKLFKVILPFLFINSTSALLFFALVTLLFVAKLMQISSRFHLLLPLALAISFCSISIFSFEQIMPVIS
jgi:hypothetical protein